MAQLTGVEEQASDRNGRTSPSPPTGLSAAEVEKRRAAGLGNNVTTQTTRSYRQILRQNALTPINIMLYIVASALLLMQLWGDAFLTASLVVLNVTAGVFQESRAKRVLDKISLLTRPKATVIRDGVEQTVDPAQLVVGDAIVVRPGDQIVVDGQLISQDEINVDESLLTGESNPVPKHEHDPVYSGSFSVSGSGVYEAERVGQQSMAQQMTASARAFRQVRTPLQHEVDLFLRVIGLAILFIAGPTIIDLIVRLLAVLTGPISGSLSDTINRAYQGYALEETIKAAAVVVGLVPQGLSLMVTVTYALSAVRLAGRGALIQQSNVLESLSHVDVLCLDKTGTLTTNRIQAHAIRPIGIDRQRLATTLGDFAASVGSRNSTAEAIATAYPGTSRTVAGEIPFSSAWKWSAVVFADGDAAGAYILGAPEVLKPALADGAELGDVAAEWTGQGLRVLLFARAAADAGLRDADGQPQLPRGLEPIGLLSFSDELRDEARSTLAKFADAGIQVKVISGDNPETVAALGRQVGIAALDDTAGADGAAPRQLVSGLELAEMTDDEFTAAAKSGIVFGRITPQQKLSLVGRLKAEGHYVAMIGDGVNDVMALKEAKVGIAMQSGSQATRGVADLVLLNDSFAVLPAAFREGQRIVSGMADIIRLFLTRSFYTILLIIGADIAGAAFPISPRHSALLAVITVGTPTFALAAWAKPDGAPKSFIRAVGPFVIPASFSIGLVTLIPYLYYVRAGDEMILARTVTTTTAMLCGIILILFVQPPSQWWVAGDRLANDWRPAALAVAMLGLFVAVMTIPSLRRLYQLTVLGWQDYLVAIVLAAIWAIGLRTVWRKHLLQRFLGISPEILDPLRPVDTEPELDLPSPTAKA